MKSKFIILISFFGLFFFPTYALAHLPSYDPYGYTKNAEPSSIQPECPLSSDVVDNQFKSKARSNFCSSFERVTRNAATIHSPDYCNLIYSELINRFPYGGQGWPFDSSLQGEIEKAINLCSNLSVVTSLIYPPPVVKKFDQNLIYLTSFLGLIYLWLVIYLKKVRFGGEAFLLPIISQIIISFIVVYVGAIFQLGSTGPAVPALHDFLFFQQRYFLRIIIIGLVTSSATVAGLSLFFSYFRQELSQNDRKTTFLVYNLVFNPVFFPVGIIFGVMNLIFLKRTKPPSQIANATSLPQK